MDNLTPNIIIFAISALSTIVFGTYLAKYGDILASITGLGRLFIGSILVALATSLPELSANISAVLLTPPNPSLALGNVFGANMVNMATFAIIALIFGGKTVLDQISRNQWYLAALAIVMTIIVLFFGLVNISLSFFNVGIASFIILGIYLLGLRVIYITKPSDSEEEDEVIEITAFRAWSAFGLISLGVIISGYFLAFSVDNIAEISGVASSTLGIIVVSLVTTMPEASSYIASVRMKAADLGVAGLFGSCVFNITIIFYADIFYSKNIINQFEDAHIIACVVSLFLISIAALLVYLKNNIQNSIKSTILFLIIVIYCIGILLITT
ncbi:MAG: hypothetical protein VX523_01790 [Chloroflexota bacterium]|nr:hypothetical protein [Chloroflexota bacterium]